MSAETPDNALEPAGTEGDSDQLPKEDTLVVRGVDDLLDEAYYEAPEYPRTARFGETPWEEAHGESIDQRLAEEEPEVWQQDPPVDGSREPDRAGRLIEDDDATESGGGDGFAVDAGVAGGGASAEEAAMFLLQEDTEDETTWSPGGSADEDDTLPD